MENIYTSNLNFITQTGIVIVEFYGNGCMNCQIMLPILTQLEATMPYIRFYRVNADTYSNLVQRYNITSLPSLLLFRNGYLLTTIIGVKSVAILRKRIERILFS